MAGTKRRKAGNTRTYKIVEVETDTGTIYALVRTVGQYSATTHYPIEVYARTSTLDFNWIKETECALDIKPFNLVCAYKKDRTIWARLSALPCCEEHVRRAVLNLPRDMTKG